MKTTLPLLALAALLSSCSIGRESVLFATKTGYGLNIDSQPPTLDLAISRGERVLAPTFEGGQALPVMASFSGDSSIGNLLFGVNAGTNFAVGRSAALLARYYGTEDGWGTGKGNGRSWETKEWEVIMPEDQYTVTGKLESAQRFYFGTETVIGIQMGLAPGYGNPESLVFGYRRKEAACVPLIETEGGKIRSASLVATSHAAASAGTEGEAGITTFFATGIAADYLMGHAAIRNSVGKRVLDEASQKAFEEENEARKNRTELGNTAEVRFAELIKKVPDADLDRARDRMESVGLIESTDLLVDTNGALAPDKKREKLIAWAKVGNDKDDVAQLESLVKWLEVEVGETAADGGQ